MDKKFETDIIIKQLNCKENVELMKSKLEYITKSIDKSNFTRNNGNTLYVKKNLVGKAFEQYTESIALAPPNSKELAIAYANRSRLLYCKNKYEESIADINRTLGFDSIDIILKLKILCRKIQNLAALGSPDCIIVYNEFESLFSKIEKKDHENCNKLNIKAKEALNNIIKVNNNDVQDMPEHVQILSTKEDESPFDSVAVKSNNESERYMVSTRDFKAGEILFVEKACIKLLEQDNYLYYCGHCFTKSLTNIPCDNCNWCMFCSEKCKNLAMENYHKIECIIISQLLLHNYKIDNSDFLSFRSLIMKINDGIENLRADKFQFSDEFKDYAECMQDRKSNSLNTKTMKSKNILLNKYAMTAAKILILLTQHTRIFNNSGVFKSIHDLQNNEDILLIGSLFVRFRKICEQNAHFIHNKSSLKKFSNKYMFCKTFNCPLQGAYIPQISSSILHSCNPNTQACLTDKGNLIIFALRPIKKNSPLYLSRNHWFLDPVKKNSLSEKIKSTCECEACTKNWPNLLQLYKMPLECPTLYAQNYNKKESDIHDENDVLVSPILNGKQMSFTQSTIRRLSKAMDLALDNLEQPSVSICELMICLNIAFNRLYGVDKMS